MSYITTYTGKHFDPVNPDASLLCIEDIAHALSLLCRGNGHVQTFFSVGQHCIACAKEAQARGLSARLVLACLLHDASECYMSHTNLCCIHDMYIALNSCSIRVQFADLYISSD